MKADAVKTIRAHRPVQPLLIRDLMPSFQPCKTGMKVCRANPNEMLCDKGLPQGW